MKYMRIVDLNALGAKWAVCWIHEPAHHLGRLLPFHVRHAVVPTCSLLLDDCLCLLSCFESRYPSVRASYSSVANLAFSAMRCPVHSLPMFGILSVNARGMKEAPCLPVLRLWFCSPFLSSSEPAWADEFVGTFPALRSLEEMGAETVFTRTLFDATFPFTSLSISIWSDLGSSKIPRSKGSFVW